MISAIQNKQIKKIKLLQNKSKARKKQDAFVIEGIKMFEESRLDGNLIKSYFSKNFYENKYKEEPNYFKDLTYEIIEDGIFNKLSDTSTPQGVLAVVKKPKYDIIDMIGDDNIALLSLENIQDPGNLGTMVRTAEAAGFTGIVLSSDCVDIFNPKVIRSTMGGIYRMPFVYVDNFKETLVEIKRKNIIIYASHLESKNYYDEITYPRRCAILIGNESTGLSNDTIKIADILVKIPMQGKTESLNAGVAASIMMYEVFRGLRSNLKTL